MTIFSFINSFNPYPLRNKLDKKIPEFNECPWRLPENACQGKVSTFIAFAGNHHGHSLNSRIFFSNLFVTGRIEWDLNELIKLKGQNFNHNSEHKLIISQQVVQKLLKSRVISPVLLVIKNSMSPGETYFKWKMYKSGAPPKKLISIRVVEHPSTSADISPFQSMGKI